MPEGVGASTIFLAILSGLIGSAICYSVELWWRNKQLPYWWVCPEEDCIFSVKASDPMIVAISADKHEKGHQYD